MKRFFPASMALALASALLAGAACSSAPTGTSTNADNTATVITTPTPTAATSHGSPDSHAGHSSGEMGGMGDHGAMKSSPDAASAPYDLQFIDTMTAHHQGAVDMGKAAATKAQHAELKEFAGKIVADQQKEIAQMKEWRAKWYAGKPEAVNMEMTGMADSMKGMDMKAMNAASGNSFDLMFIDMMTPHHEGAVLMAREALQKGEHAEIKQLARAIMTAQEAEIKKMQAWKTQWSQQ